MTPLEATGDLYIKNQELLAEYRKLLEMISRIKSGEIDLQSFELLPNDSWRLNITIDGTNLKTE